MTSTITTIDEKICDAFRPGYTDVLIAAFSEEFEWTGDKTRVVLRDALRFLALCAVPPAGQCSHEARVMISSPIVDRIVDAIFLDTPFLMWLEREVFSVRLVHVPAYAHDSRDPIINDLHYEFTIGLMLAAGYTVDRALWPSRLPDGYMPCRHGGNDDCLVRAAL